MTTAARWLRYVLKKGKILIFDSDPKFCQALAGYFSYKGWSCSQSDASIWGLAEMIVDDLDGVILGPNHSQTEYGYFCKLVSQYLTKIHPMVLFSRRDSFEKVLFEEIPERLTKVCSAPVNLSDLEIWLEGHLNFQKSFRDGTCCVFPIEVEVGELGLAP